MYFLNCLHSLKCWAKLLLFSVMNSEASKQIIKHISKESWWIHAINNPFHQTQLYTLVKNWFLSYKSNLIYESFNGSNKNYVFCQWAESIGWFNLHKVHVSEKILYEYYGAQSKKGSYDTGLYKLLGFCIIWSQFSKTKD